MKIGDILALAAFAVLAFVFAVGLASIIIYSISLAG